MSDQPPISTVVAADASPDLGIVTEDRPSILPAVLAGLLATAIGAAAWAVMVIVTDHSFGIAAIGLGLLSGALVSRASGGRRSMGLVAIGLCSLVAALAIGKYAAFAYDIHKAAQEQFGSAGADAYGYLSGNTWSAFRSDLSQEFSAYYALWLGIGALSVWRALSPTHRPPARPSPPQTPPSAPPPGS